jgi:hypothetical protein
VATKKQRRRKLRSRRRHTREVRSYRAPELRETADDVPSEQSPDSSVPKSRREEIGGRLLSIGVFAQVSALVLFGVAWWVFKEPHVGAIISAVVAGAGFLTFWVGVFVFGRADLVFSWFGLALAIALSSVAAAFTVGVATSIWWLGLIVGVVLLAGGLVWSFSIDKE